MYRLKRHNIIKEVDTEHKMKKLMSEGFALVSQPSFENSVTSLPKPQSSDDGHGDEMFKCLHCEKEYKSNSALNVHIKKEHPETLDDE